LGSERSSYLGRTVACTPVPARRVEISVEELAGSGTESATTNRRSRRPHSCPTAALGQLAGRTFGLVGQATLRSRRWRFLATEPGRIAKWTWPSSSTAITLTTACA